MADMTNGTQSVAVARSLAIKKLTVGGCVVLVVGIGLSIAAAKGVFSSSAPSTTAKALSAAAGAATNTTTPLTFEGRGAGLEALSQAAADNKYLFAFFWKSDNDQTAAMKKVFEDATVKVADRAMAVTVRVSDSAERGIVKKYDLERAPMPLVLAIAPNGAITGGFPTKFEEAELLGAFASPGTEKCMKALQDGKLVFLCVQNDATQSNQEALQGVQEFKLDERYASATEVVVLDPRDTAEASFLGDLKIDPQTTTAVTAFLAPPGSVIAEYQGATTKDELMKALQQANTGCGPGGCGPGGCAPK
jgi:hypothetical protein